MNERISIDAERWSGHPCIAGTRIMVANVLAMLGDGASFEDIIRSYPALTRDDISASVDFAIDVVEARRLVRVG